MTSRPVFRYEADHDLTAPPTPRQVEMGTKHLHSMAQQLLAAVPTRGYDQFRAVCQAVLSKPITMEKDFVEGSLAIANASSLLLPFDRKDELPWMAEVSRIFNHPFGPTQS